MKKTKVLFVVSGNGKHFKVAPFIRRQAESIRKGAFQVDFFKVKGRGISGYLSNVRRLRQRIREGNYDIVHAHYTFNALLTLLTFERIPLVTSYMGSDTYGEYDAKGRLRLSSVINILISQFIQPFTKKIIVKSPNLYKYIFLKHKVHLIPNGIDIQAFKPVEKAEARTRLGITTDKPVILFLGNPDLPRKNIKLLRGALEKLKHPEQVEVLTPYPAAPESIPLYLNSADVLALCSYNEGSPNVIKEAMACNTPIVSTPVGDVEWLLQEVEGAYLARFDGEHFAAQLERALQFAAERGKTNGRERLLDLGLDGETVAGRIQKLYQRLTYANFKKSHEIDHHYSAGYKNRSQ